MNTTTCNPLYPCRYCANCRRRARARLKRLALYRLAYAERYGAPPAHLDDFQRAAS